MGCREKRSSLRDVYLLSVMAYTKYATDAKGIEQAVQGIERGFFGTLRYAPCAMRSPGMLLALGFFVLAC